MARIRAMIRILGMIALFSHSDRLQPDIDQFDRRSLRLQRIAVKSIVCGVETAGDSCRIAPFDRLQRHIERHLVILL